MLLFLFLCKWGERITSRSVVWKGRYSAKSARVCMETDLIMIANLHKIPRMYKKCI